MRSLVAVVLGMVVVLGPACGGSRRSGFGPDDEDAGGHGSSGSSSSSGGSPGESSSSGSSGGGSSSGSAAGSLVGDGGMGSVPQGCPPCSTENVNIAGSTCDLDCSGSTSPPVSCDTGLAVDGPASAFAQAIGICQMADATHWGLVSASYTRGYDSTTVPADGQHAILPGFGTVITPREGGSLGVLSSGYALPCDDGDASTICSASGTGDPYFKGIQFPMYEGQGSSPPSYPKSTASCQADSSVYDTIGVTLQIKVPANAQGFSFDFDFYSGEWPEFVCTEFNDSFVAWLQSTAWAGNGGDLNISLDSMNNPVSVNNGFFDRCTMNAETGCAGGGGFGTTGGGGSAQTAACAGGPAELQGTGFYNEGMYCSIQTTTGGGATGWLTTKAPVTGGETITLQLIIWDTGDWSYDSSVLVDNLQWYGTAQMTGTTRPPAQ